MPKKAEEEKDEKRKVQGLGKRLKWVEEEEDARDVVEEEDEEGQEEEVEEPESEHLWKAGIPFYPMTPTSFVVVDAFKPDYPIVYVYNVFEIFTRFNTIGALDIGHIGNDTWKLPSINKCGS